MFMKHQIIIFGAPNCIFNDNGGEFMDDEFYDMCGKGTASFSPWRIGTCDRHNHPIIIMLMILKICDDVKCSYDTALA